MSKKIGIIGSGHVARELAKGFLDQGFEVMIGSGNLAKIAEISSQLKVLTGNFEQAATFGDILVLAVKGAVAIKVFGSLSEDSVKGKTILDATNPIAEVPPVHGVLQYFTKQNESLGAELQKVQPAAHIVKAFNSVGAAHMYKPSFKSGKPTMFICGNNEQAKSEAVDIIDSFGLEVADMGSIDAAGAIEALCVLWCIKGFKEGTWNHAFKLLV